MANNRSIGTKTEGIACEYLKICGYTVIEQNFRCLYGEIDIISKDEDYICFVEVKYRRTDIKGKPCEAVTYKKQQTIIKVAEAYIAKHNLYNTNFRFDVIELSGNLNNLTINLIKNAFQL